MCVEDTSGIISSVFRTYNRREWLGEARLRIFSPEGVSGTLKARKGPTAREPRSPWHDPGQNPGREDGQQRSGRLAGLGWPRSPEGERSLVPLRLSLLGTADCCAANARRRNERRLRKPLGKTQCRLVNLSQLHVWQCLPCRDQLPHGKPGQLWGHGRVSLGVAGKMLRETVAVRSAAEAVRAA